ncbi:hypothetical protein BKA67DRAFT_661187 [Truncatella angustata]|uniref:Uncharacterized protein n=1 Tax=Truncatella angustata TaxID=152316 RepID=A0A9P8UHV7_9PEZI|nr:uncharacterized protein BKA67DRAFT_661187 [Truncatella angustata]KAH6652448.1 hypothetical protein BKA67DRAFT_661187 [Truncatella angustata]
MAVAVIVMPSFVLVIVVPAVALVIGVPIAVLIIVSAVVLVIVVPLLCCTLVVCLFHGVLEAVPSIVVHAVVLAVVAVAFTSRRSGFPLDIRDSNRRGLLQAAIDGIGATKRWRLFDFGGCE